MGIPAQSVAVIVAVFKAFYTIADCIDYIEIREDIRSVAVYLYSGAFTHFQICEL
jgi:molybdopterin/thiamine biosynthesis adenylyltransferase